MEHFTSRVHGVTGWLNGVLTGKMETTNVLNALIEGNNLQMLLETLIGQSQTRIQSFQGLTENQKIIRVDWFINSLKKENLLPSSFKIQSRLFVKKSSDAIFETLSYMVLFHLICIQEVLSKFLQPLKSGSLVKNKLTFSAQEKVASTFDIEELQELSLQILNQILRNDKYTRRLQLSELSGLADSRTLCAIINTFIPGTFTAEVLLSDRWTIALCLECITKALRTNFLIEIPDLLSGDELTLSSFVASLCIQGIRFRQHSLVRERAKRLEALLKENQSQLDWIRDGGPTSAEGLKFKAKSLEENIFRYQSEFDEISANFDLKYCEEWQCHVCEVQKQVRSKILKQMEIRFDQIISPSPMTINELCEEYAINLALTCNIAFYRPLTKETIWPERKIVLFERGKRIYYDNFTGQLSSADIYRMLGLPVGKLAELTQSKHEKKYDIFVSSSTRNKKLPANSPLLYQVFPGTRSQCEKLLHRACRDGEITIVEKLITFFNSEVSFVNSKDCNGNTALHHSSRSNCMDISLLLLQNGANVNLCNNLLQSPFHSALDAIQKETGLLLQEWCVNTDLRDRNNKTAFDIIRNAELKKSMLAKRTQMSDIQILCLNRKKEELQALVQDHTNNFTSLRSRIFSGMTFLHLAAKHNIPEIIRIYSDLDIDINLPDAKGRSPMHYVTRKDTAQLLLECGADPNCRDFKENTVLHLICASRFRDEIEILNAQECMRFLIKLEVSNLSMNSDKLLPIHNCSISGNCALIETLLEEEHGKELKLAFRENSLEQAKSPLYLAVILQQQSCVQTLLKHELLFLTGEVEDLLFKALGNEFPCGDILNTTSFLLGQGVDVRYSHPESANNALHLAVQLGPTPVIDLLIQSGVNVNHENKLGETPLFIACRLDNDYAASRLIGCSCDYMLQNKRKKVAFDYIGDYEQWIRGGHFKGDKEMLARLRAHSLLSARDMVRNISKSIDKRELQSKVSLTRRSKSKQ